MPRVNKVLPGQLRLNFSWVPMDRALTVHSSPAQQKLHKLDKEHARLLRAIGRKRRQLQDKDIELEKAAHAVSARLEPLREECVRLSEKVRGLFLKFVGPQSRLSKLNKRIVQQIFDDLKGVVLVDSVSFEESLREGADRLGRGADEADDELDAAAQPDALQVEGDLAELGSADRACDGDWVAENVDATRFDFGANEPVLDSVAPGGELGDTPEEGAQAVSGAPPFAASAEAPHTAPTSGGGYSANKPDDSGGMSIKALFKKLAAALHPDRAPDDAERARRTEIFREVARAYENNDFARLIELEATWHAAVDTRNSGALHAVDETKARIAHLTRANKDLRGQLRQLQEQETELQRSAPGRFTEGGEFEATEDIAALLNELEHGLEQLRRTEAFCLRYDTGEMPVDEFLEGPELDLAFGQAEGPELETEEDADQDGDGDGGGVLDWLAAFQGIQHASALDDLLDADEEWEPTSAAADPSSTPVSQGSTGPQESDPAKSKSR